MYRLYEESMYKEQGQSSAKTRIYTINLRLTARATNSGKVTELIQVDLHLVDPCWQRLNLKFK